MLNKILVPLDGSDLAEAALRPALDLVQPVGGKVILLQSTVLMHLIVPETAGGYTRPQPGDLGDRFRRHAREYLLALDEKWRRPEVELELEVTNEDPAEAIVDTAVEEGADLIVMTAHGASASPDRPLGSVTEAVLREAPCPVLVVRDGQPISRMVVTLDGSELAERALEPALEIARRLTARVILLEVLPPEALEQMIAPAALVSPYLEEVAQRYRLLLEQGLETAVVIGAPVSSILKFANAENIDLIAMTTHGRTGLRHWLYGSVTQKVMHDFGRSMLVVRPPVPARR